MTARKLVLVLIIDAHSDDVQRLGAIPRDPDHCSAASVFPVPFSLVVPSRSLH